MAPRVFAPEGLWKQSQWAAAHSAEHYEGPWHYSPVPAATPLVTWTDGSSEMLSRRERPQVLTNADGDVEVLYNGVCCREGPGHTEPQDSYTLAVPTSAHRPRTPHALKTDGSEDAETSARRSDSTTTEEACSADADAEAARLAASARQEPYRAVSRTVAGICAALLNVLTQRGLVGRGSTTRYTRPRRCGRSWQA